MFENTQFIKANIQYNADNFSYAPMFRKTFTIDTDIESAEISVCGLGYGYYYINGKPVSEDLFTAPVSNYTKTLWYNRYDVTSLLKKGENTIAVMCGNGWYNEGIETVWHYETAIWRDNPKFICTLSVNGKECISSDSTWKCNLNSPVIYNQLRSGEHFDSRLYDENWKNTDFDDSDWEFAKIDDTPPTGIFRECLCEPIRECEVYTTKEMIKISENKYIFDIGQNISGYIRLRTNQDAGDIITISYAEQVYKDYTRNLNDMERFYRGTPFMVDEFICCGKEFVWSPKFVYHGFRYIIIEGIKNPSPEDVQGVFVHQDIKICSTFECSNEKLNKLFRAGQMATYSNLFYMPTDCPTREKLGWANDAQASCEQFLTNLETEKVLVKWLQDIYDAQTDEGALPGIIPTPGWGYEGCNGPVSDGILFEIPYRIFKHTGNNKYLIDSIPYFKKYFEHLDNKADENGVVSFGLKDWASPEKDENAWTPAHFVNAVLKVKFLRIMQIALSENNEDNSEYKNEEQLEINRIFDRYINEDGTCNINKQSAVAMLIYHDIYKDITPLANQLKERVESHNFHHNCGMVGLRHLYIALNKIGLQEYAYKVVTATGFPSLMDWIDHGATTLWEYWDLTYSKNHHMYSDFMSWMMKTIVGIDIDFSEKGNEKAYITPYIFNDLDYAKGSINTSLGKISVEWRKTTSGTEVKYTVPENIKVCFR